MNWDDLSLMARGSDACGNGICKLETDEGTMILFCECGSGTFDFQNCGICFLTLTSITCVWDMVIAMLFVSPLLLL